MNFSKFSFFALSLTFRFSYPLAGNQSYNGARGFLYVTRMRSESRSEVPVRAMRFIETELQQLETVNKEFNVSYSHVKSKRTAYFPFENTTFNGKPLSDLVIKYC